MFFGRNCFIVTSRHIIVHGLNSVLLGLIIHDFKNIMTNHKITYDAQAVLYELATEAITSTSAVLGSRALLKALTASQFNPRNAGSTAIKYITNFQRQVTVYNEQQAKSNLVLNDELKKTLLQAGVSNVGLLRAVGDREQDSIIRGGDPFTYAQYLTVLKSQATLYNEQSSGRRSANTHDLSINVSDSQDPRTPVIVTSPMRSMSSLSMQCNDVPLELL
jgi:hypothetical protein